MSRIGRKPITVPAGVDVKIDGSTVTVKGPKGTLTQTFRPEMGIKQEGSEILVTRPNDEKEMRSLHGLTRTLVANMVQGVTEELVRLQTKIALGGVSAEEMKNVVIAYEPVWAIGTGRTATSEQAQEVCAAIRKVLAELYGQAVATATTVQYGGSMNAANADELLAKPDVDGGLIGGASLKADAFAAIVAAAGK